MPSELLAYPCTQNKASRNFSNINLTDLAPSQPINNNPTANFRTYSQVGNLLKDIPNKNSKVQVDKDLQRYHQYTYQNKIGQNYDKKVYKVPQTEDVQFQRTNKNFIQTINRKKKFIKPYSDCTKYVDNLMKNKQLLRRGQFDLPIENEAVSNCLARSNITKTKNTQFSAKLPIKTLNAQFIRSRNYRMKQYQSIQQIKNKNKKTSDQKNGFDKTVTTNFGSYRQMLEIERNGKKQEIKLKNSMNRILAAEMINHRLSTADPNSMVRTRSMRLDKTH